MEILNKKQKIIVAVLLTAMCIVIGYYIISKTEKYDYSEIEKASNTIEENKEILDDNSVEDKIIIHITGEVEEEGVIELEKGARISDAIGEAGGTTEEADLSNVNLAYSLSDGQKVKIPNINEKNKEVIIEEEAGENIIIEENKSKAEKVNINKATQTEIETLPGIGPSTALKIINYRNEHGKFKNIEDIKNVSGIGDSKFENIKEYICTE